MHIVIWRGLGYSFRAPLAAIRFLARLTGQGVGVTIRRRPGATIYSARKGGR